MTELSFLAGPEGGGRRKGTPEKRAQRRRNGLTIAVDKLS